MTIKRKKLAYILQGVSGAGKSTVAQRLVAGLPQGKGVVVSADDFFIDPTTGKYNFDASRLGEAHAQCLRSFAWACIDHPEGTAADVVVCDNTNTSVVEVAPYYALAQAFGYTPTIILVGENVSMVDAFERNQHGVPLTGVMAQGNRIVEFGRVMPPWWTRMTLEEWQAGSL